MSIGTLRKHIASLPEQVFIDQPDGFLRGFHQAIEALLLCLVCQLPGNILLVGLIPGHGVGTGYRGKDNDLQPDASDQVFSYLVCAICPVKDGKPALGFFAGENEFHSCMAKQIVGQPELGFLFPAFDNRSANLYNALYYLRKPEVSHPEFVEAVFRTELPMTSVEQREAFCGALQEALEEDCSVDVVQAVHERPRELVEGHKEAKIAEPLEVSAREIGQFLRDAGISDQRVQQFCQQCDERFGKQAPLHPENLVDCRRFQLKTESASVTVDPAQSYQVEGRILEGRKYLLIPADDGAELNGVPVDIRKQ